MTRQRSRWVYMAATWWAMASSTLQQFTIVVLAATLIDDLGVSRWEVGLLGATNTGVGALLSPRLGRLSDRLGCRRAMSALGLVSAAGLLCTAIATSYSWLVVASAIAGLGQGAATPVTSMVISQRMDAKQRGLAAGLSQSGVQASVMLSGMLLPIAAATAGWRWAVAMLGVVTFLGAVVTQAPRPPYRGRFGRRQAGAPQQALVAAGGSSGAGGSDAGDADQDTDSADTDSADQAGGEQNSSAGTSERDAMKFVYRVAIYSFCLGVTAGGVNRFYPLFVHEVLGFTEGLAAVAICMGGLVAVAGRLVWARMAANTIDPPNALLMLGVGSAVAVGLLVITELFGTWILWPAIVLIAFTVSAWNAVAMVAVLKEVSPELSGRATGVVLMGFLGGLTVAAPLVGYFIDLAGSYQPTWIGLGVLALAGAGAVSPPTAWLGLSPASARLTKYLPRLRLPRLRLPAMPRWSVRRIVGRLWSAGCATCDKRRREAAATRPPITLTPCSQRPGILKGSSMPAGPQPMRRPAAGIVWSSYFCDQRTQDRAHGRHIVDDGRLHVPALRRRRARRFIHR